MPSNSGGPDNRPPEVKDALRLHGWEEMAKAAENSGDRQHFLQTIQDAAHNLSQPGLAYAKSVYAELAKLDKASGEVPLLELTNNGSLELKNPATMQAAIAKDQNIPDVKLQRDIDRILRQDVGLPNSASNAEVNAAFDKKRS